jgi:hypothetical protein
MTNQTLSILDLRDIIAPDPVNLWPPAPFVWVLLGVAGFGLTVLIWRAVALWRAGAYRRAGLAHLAQIEGQFAISGSEVAALQELSVLMKRVALAAFPRKQIAPLYGENWLRFLDSTCEGCTFMTGPGHLPAAVTYAVPKASQVNADDGKQLVNLARAWIKGHRTMQMTEKGKLNKD